MPAKVTVDIKGLEDRFAPKVLKNAQTMFAMQVGEDMNAYVHDDTKQLQDSMRTSSDFPGGKIVWSAKNERGEDYAQHAYEEDPGPRDKNPKATPHWDKAASAAHHGDWRKAAASLLNGGAR